MIQPLLDAKMGCPSCQFGLREFLINTDYLACPHCETLFRKREESIDPREACVKESYRERAIEILRLDKGHYEAFYSNPVIVEKFRIPLLYKDYVLAMGGGHPKLESYLKPKHIEICDYFPDVYLETLDYFRELYDYHGHIGYQRIEIDGSYSFPDLPSPANSLITFVHFLEHLSYEPTVRLLKILPSNTDVCIYGPNSEIKPMGKNWFHFSPQHLTLIPLKRLKEILLDMGYLIKYDTAFGQDMLIFFNTGDNI
ncbi:MAG: hypothetical protein JRL30_05725 [Deltaproteobacteria bacterium]|nr:hypothetical protein [Deltaproteobacteria bacterium]